LKVCLAIILIVLCTPTAAQVDNKVDIELYTFGAGENYWEAFGHTAIRVKINEIDYMYGFGYFNFSDEDFFLKFAKGKMQYFLGIEETNLEIDNYINQGRSVWSQKLNLDPSQKQQLIARLNYLALAENRYYHYDYFLNNCTSQIRDLLDEVTNGEISKQLIGIETNKSWNDLTFPVSNQTWMNLGIAIAYGIPAYQSRDKWSLSIFPEDFAHDLEQIDTQTNWNGKLMQQHKAAEQLIKHSFIKTHYAVIALVSLILIGLFIPILTKFTVYTWLIGQSLIGIALLFLWFFSEHSVAVWNINLLLFPPFAFVLLHKRSFTRLSNVFLISTILWVILALFFTNIYLIVFGLINFTLIYKLKTLYK
jgi:hypothetical protein